MKITIELDDSEIDSFVSEAECAEYARIGNF